MHIFHFVDLLKQNKVKEALDYYRSTWDCIMKDLFSKSNSEMYVNYGSHDSEEVSQNTAIYGKIRVSLNSI